MAKPRVFISSTFYDMKHLRNDLNRFIRQYGFEPVLSEIGSIPYGHCQPLDESCFQEAQLCDIFILIIGGRYGSVITEEQSNNNENIDFYKRYTSITRKEYRTAFEKYIPIYIFIDKNVFAEYHTYLQNKSNTSLKYAYSDNIGVYEFIEEAENSFKNNNICSFEKFDDIESWLREQWAGLFHKYLTELRTKKENNKVISYISRLELVTENMSKMINEVGKKVLAESDEYHKITTEQLLNKLKLHAEMIADNFNIINKVREDDGKKLFNLLLYDYLYNEEFNAAETINEFPFLITEAGKEYLRSLKSFKDLRDKIQVFENPPPPIPFGKTYKLYQFEIRPIIENNPDFKKVFEQYLYESFKQKYILPF